jgi:hypothetical protein
MAQAVPVRRPLLTILMPSQLLVLPVALGGQRVTMSATPGFAYSSSLRSGSLGGKVDVFVRRTRTVSVGGELGYFTAGSSKYSHVLNDPMHGLLDLEYDTRHDFWLGAAVARYELPGSKKVRAHTTLSTGLYRFGSREAVEGSDREGNTIDWATHSHESHGLVPGVGAGLGALVPLGPSGTALDVEFRAHAIIGAGEAVYPVLTVTAGLRRAIKR